ncbi:MAG: hypothetical protein P1V97_00540 [Planctomycetota bacterium]|nr:hypothetical protein [Planctomycetota bacterium]
MRQRKSGQGMTEYIIIVGLIAIVLIFAVKQYGKTVDVAIQGGTTGVEGVVDDMPGDNPVDTTPVPDTTTPPTPPG